MERRKSNSCGEKFFSGPWTGPSTGLWIAPWAETLVRALAICVTLGAGGSPALSAERDPDWVPWQHLALDDADDMAFREFSVQPQLEADYLGSVRNWVRVIRAAPSEQNKLELCRSHIKNPVNLAAKLEKNVLGHQALFEKVYPKTVVARALALSRAVKKLADFCSGPHSARPSSSSSPGDPYSGLLEEVVRLRNEFSSIHLEMEKTARSLYDQESANHSAVEK